MSWLPLPVLAWAPVATRRVLVDRLVKLVALQEAEALVPDGLMAAVLQRTWTADTGTVVQPVKVLVAVATLRLHVPPGFPCRVQETVAAELPAIVDPGLFAVNEMEEGDACRLCAFW